MRKTIKTPLQLRAVQGLTLWLVCLSSGSTLAQADSGKGAFYESVQRNSATVEVETNYYTEAMRIYFTRRNIETQMKDPEYMATVDKAVADGPVLLPLPPPGDPKLRLPNTELLFDDLCSLSLNQEAGLDNLGAIAQKFNRVSAVEAEDTEQFYITQYSVLNTDQQMEVDEIVRGLQATRSVTEIDFVAVSREEPNQFADTIIQACDNQNLRNSF